jgi:hypothetical protein
MCTQSTDVATCAAMVRHDDRRRDESTVSVAELVERSFRESRPARLYLVPQLPEERPKRKRRRDDEETVDRPTKSSRWKLW